MNFSRLFKKTSTGAIQYWEICFGEDTVGDLNGIGDEEISSESLESVAWIQTEWGQLGTSTPQITCDLIKEGKNIGKKNETTRLQQAESEAKSKWEKQKKKGYVETAEAAKADELDDLIEGGIVPMLAHKFSEQGHKIKYPAFVQPKLDGIRCIAILKNGKCTLWSRTRKLITGVPHISAAIERAFQFKEDVVLDGELYNHQYKSQFEKIVSFVRQEKPAPGHEVVQYHVYDLPSSETFGKRATKLRYMKESWFPNQEVVKVETVQVEDESQALDWFQTWRGQGYEGAMIRNAEGLYVNKRSKDLQKIKEMEDNDFRIIGVEEGRGKLYGHVGAFVCKTNEGKEFLAKMSGDTNKLKEYFENHSLWEGKLLTVQYQGLTGSNGVPRFPVGKVIRDYE